MRLSSNAESDRIDPATTCLPQKDMREVVDVRVRPFAKQAPAIPRTILFADPNDEVCSQHSKHLVDYFYDVITARNGSECVEVLRNETPDLVVLNCDVAWGSGDGMLCYMRLKSRRSRIPMILTTAQTLIDQIPPAPFWPIVECLQSPYEFPELLEAVRRALATTLPMPARCADDQISDGELANCSSWRNLTHPTNSPAAAFEIPA